MAPPLPDKQTELGYVAPPLPGKGVGLVAVKTITAPLPDKQAGPVAKEIVTPPQPDNEAEPVAKGSVTQPPLLYDEAEPVVEGSVTPPPLPDNKVEPVVEGSVTPPPLPDNEAEPVVEGSVTPPPLPDNEAEPVVEGSVIPPPLLDDEAEPVAKGSVTPPPNKYVLRWPGLADHMLIRGAKLDALAVLQQSQTKRLLRRRKITSPGSSPRRRRRSQQPTAKRANGVPRRRRGPKGKNGVVGQDPLPTEVDAKLVNGKTQSQTLDTDTTLEDKQDEEISYIIKMPLSSVTLMSPGAKDVTSGAKLGPSEPPGPVKRRGRATKRQRKYDGDDDGDDMPSPAKRKKKVLAKQKVSDAQEVAVQPKRRGRPPKKPRLLASPSPPPAPPPPPGNIPAPASPSVSPPPPTVPDNRTEGDGTVVAVDGEVNKASGGVESVEHSVLPPPAAATTRQEAPATQTITVQPKRRGRPPKVKHPLVPTTKLMAVDLVKAKKPVSPVKTAEGDKNPVSLDPACVKIAEGGKAPVKAAEGGKEPVAPAVTTSKKPVAPPSEDSLVDHGGVGEADRATLESVESDRDRIPALEEEPGLNEDNSTPLRSVEQDPEPPRSHSVTPDPAQTFSVTPELARVTPEPPQANGVANRVTPEPAQADCVTPEPAQANRVTPEPAHVTSKPPLAEESTSAMSPLSKKKKIPVGVSDAQEVAVQPKRRGRPPKKPQPVQGALTAQTTIAQPKRRGRPPKVKVDPLVSGKGGERAVKPAVKTVGRGRRPALVKAGVPPSGDGTVADRGVSETIMGSSVEPSLCEKDSALQQLEANPPNDVTPVLPQASRVTPEPPQANHGTPEPPQSNWVTSNPSHRVSPELTPEPAQANDLISKASHVIPQPTQTGHLISEPSLSHILYPPQGDHMIPRTSQTDQVISKPFQANQVSSQADQVPSQADQVSSLTDYVIPHTDHVIPQTYHVIPQTDHVIPKRRGRPKKKPATEEVRGQSSTRSDDDIVPPATKRRKKQLPLDTTSTPSDTQPPPKKRGRPKKKPHPLTSILSELGDGSIVIPGVGSGLVPPGDAPPQLLPTATHPASQQPKRRGRPPKNKRPVPPALPTDTSSISKRKSLGVNGALVEGVEEGDTNICLVTLIQNSTQPPPHVTTIEPLPTSPTPLVSGSGVLASGQGRPRKGGAARKTATAKPPPVPADGTSLPRRGRPPKKKAPPVSSPALKAQEMKKRVTSSSQQALAFYGSGGGGGSVVGQPPLGEWSRGVSEPSGAGGGVGTATPAEAPLAPPQSVETTSPNPPPGSRQHRDQLPPSSSGDHHHHHQDQPPKGTRGRRHHHHHSDAQVAPSHERGPSPEIPIQNTNLNVSMPITPSPPSSSSSPSSSAPPPPLQKGGRRRKTLESVLSSLRENRLSKNGESSLDNGADLPPRTITETAPPQEPVRLSQAKESKGQSSKGQGPARKRKTLVGKQAREKSDAFKLSVVADEVSYQKKKNIPTCSWVACQEEWGQ